MGLISMRYLEFYLLGIIIAIVIAVVGPIFWKVTHTVSYTLIRQGCSELAGFTMQWVEKEIQAQDEEKSTATVKDYFASLAGAPKAPNTGALPGQWVACQSGNTNWNLGKNGTTAERSTTAITGRYKNGVADQAPEFCVEDIIPPDKVICNPYNDVSVFRAPNDPVAQGQAVLGAIAFGGALEAEGSWVYYAFAFQGNFNTTINLAGDDTTFNNGMGLDTIPKLRNGILVGRFR